MKTLVKRIAFTIGLVFAGFIVSAQETEAIPSNQTSGIEICLAALIIVFLTLFLFYVIFKLINNFTRAKQKRNNEAYAAVEGKPAVQEEISGEVFAAISTALYLYETEQHDYESTILTINRAAKNYSPWNSKIYGLRQLPRR